MMNDIRLLYGIFKLAPLKKSNLFGMVVFGLLAVINYMGKFQSQTFYAGIYLGLLAAFMNHMLVACCFSNMILASECAKMLQKKLIPRLNFAMIFVCCLLNGPVMLLLARLGRISMQDAAAQIVIVSIFYAIMLVYLALYVKAMIPAMIAYFLILGVGFLTMQEDVMGRVLNLKFPGITGWSQPFVTAMILGFLIVVVFGMLSLWIAKLLYRRAVDEKCMGMMMKRDFK